MKWILSAIVIIAIVYCCIILFLYAHYLIHERYRQAEFVGKITERRDSAITLADREFYNTWLENLKERGYMWGK